MSQQRTALATRVVAITGLGLGAWSCSFLLNTDTLSSDTRADAGRDGAPLHDATMDSVTQDQAVSHDTRIPRDAAVDSAAQDHAVGHDANDSSADAGPCPSAHGPPMIEVGSMFCIDSTEVTNAQYEEFLMSGPGVQVGVCSWNTSLAPTSGWPYAAGRDFHPVTFVDWCDAFAFCEWAGKRLCGAIGGGAVPPADVDSPTSDEHFYACSQGGAKTYPYGDTWAAGSCNDSTSDTAPVGSFTACVGGFPGLYDMVGSVEEWQNSCSGDAGAGDSCADGTGAFDYPSGSQSSCGFSDADLRNTAELNIGFRCCADGT
jgi:formylglycine-generating enzyme required for sulfatase activity